MTFDDLTGADAATGVLKRTSSALDIKLRQVSEVLVETRQLPPTA